MSAAAAPSVSGRPAHVLRAGPPSAVRVLWQDFPEELRHIAEPYLMRELPILPRWVSELRLEFDTDDPSGLWTRIHPEYRTGRIGFCASWFAGTPQYKRSSLRHEFSHFALEPLAAFARELIGKVEADDRFASHLREQLRKAMECSTCDVEEMLSAALEMERA